MYDRKKYINKIMLYTDMPFIKIITGMQRCGKTTILHMIQDRLQIERGIPEAQCVYYRFDTMAYKEISSAYLEECLKQHIIPNKRTYFFLDEIHCVDGWEEIVGALQAQFDVDIYVTGSNARVASSPVQLELAGRFIIFHIYPISFKEYLTISQNQAPDNTDIKNEFMNYMQCSTLPLININRNNRNELYTRIQDIYSAIVYTQILKQNKIRRPEQIDQVFSYILHHIGETFSAKAIVDALKTNQYKADNETVSSYLEKLASAYIIRRCQRYDLQQQLVLKTQQKFYLTDIAMYHAYLGFDEENLDKYIENLVYLELCRRGYEVYIGKLGNKEITFVAKKHDETIYIQVLAKHLSQEIKLQRYDALLSIRDNYPKYVLRTDDFTIDNYHGVKTMQVTDFLLMEY